MKNETVKKLSMFGKHVTIGLVVDIIDTPLGHCANILVYAKVAGDEEILTQSEFNAVMNSGFGSPAQFDVAIVRTCFDLGVTMSDVAARRISPLQNPMDVFNEEFQS